MSGIVIGGLLGAAAAMYFSRTNRTFSFSGISSAGQAIDNIVEKARSKMMPPDKRSYYGDSTANQGAGAATTAAGGINQVETMVNKDPALKAQVNEILSEGGSPTQIR